MEENQKKKCSSKKHGEIDAIYYCPECGVYMCNKCQSFHSDLFQMHSSYNLDKNLDEIFNCKCKEKNHGDLLIYFCKSHNQLCCAKCISKIEGKGNGQHSNCDICFIEDIKEIKKNKLKQNINILEKISNGLEQSIIDLNKIFEKINNDKDNITKKIQKIFTKLKNALNEREDQLLSEVCKLFDDLFFNENIIKENEKLPNKVKASLEKGKLMDNEWNDENKLCSLINDCINIEKNIQDIIEINEKINKCKSLNIEVKFKPEEEEKIDKCIKKIENFGNVYHTGKDGYKLIKRPLINNDNNILLISNKKIPILYNLLKFNNIINKINVEDPKFVLPRLTYQNIKEFKILIYDLQDSGYGDTNNIDEIRNYLINGGNIIVTHDHWSHNIHKGCAQLFGAKLQNQNYNITKKAKINKNDHPVFTSFYDLYLENQTIIEVSNTHKSDTIFEDIQEYYKDLLIELDDGKHGEYLLIKEIGKGKLIYWNTGHSYDLTDYEKKLFMNFIYWICE